MRPKSKRPHTESLSVKIPKDLKDRIVDRAWECRSSISKMLVKILDVEFPGKKATA